MGDRINVVVTTDHEKGIALYSHWGGYRMPKTIAKFLKKTGRLDSDYFTRNLLCNMIADSLTDNESKTSGFEFTSAEDRLQLLSVFEDELSFGIGLNLAGDREHPVLVINPETQGIWVVDDYDIITIAECVSRALRNKEISFEEFKSVESWSDVKRLSGKVEELV